MKEIVFRLLFLIPFVGMSQHYVDLVSVKYGKTNGMLLKDANQKADAISLDSYATLPLVVNDKVTVITGFNFETIGLQFFPNLDKIQFYNTLLKAGVRIKYSPKWSSTLLILPKLASDYQNINKEQLYFGGLAIFKKTKKDSSNYSIGLYSSTEAYGVYVSPIIGYYYQHPDKQFELKFYLPNELDFNYCLNTKYSLGLDYNGHGRSFTTQKYNLSTTYIQDNTLEFGTYFQNKTCNDQLLIRLKLGYSSNNYEVYSSNDKLALQVAAFKFGDKRTQLNAGFQNSLFLKIEAIFRLNLSKYQKKQ